MRWSWVYGSKYSWHRWFAWHPVWVGQCYVWLETIERKLVEGGFGDVLAEYRLPEDGRGERA